MSSLCNLSLQARKYVGECCQIGDEVLWSYTVLLMAEAYRIHLPRVGMLTH